MLEKHGAPLMIYVAPALINGTADLWWEVIEDIVAARDVSLRADAGAAGDARLLVAGAQICGQRLSARLSDAEVREEDQRDVVRELRAVGRRRFRAAAPQTLMTWDEIRSIAAHPLATIGAHTVNHYNLKRLSRGEGPQRNGRCRRASCDSSSASRRGIWPIPTAMPRRSCKREVELAREAGFVSAVTTRHGVLRAEHADHLHALPRISVNGRYQRVAHIRTMLSGVTTPLANPGKMLVTV